jgi:peroxiredoxin
VILTLENHAVPAAGSAAPDFTLPSTAGSDVTLSSFRDKSPVLLAFFPLAFTSTCTAEMCAFTDDYDRFRSTGVEILPISVDAIASLKEYKAKLGMRVDLLSDFRRAVSVRYGVLQEDKFYARRSYFLIDRMQTVRWSHVEVQNGQRRENPEILARIAELR